MAHNPVQIVLHTDQYMKRPDGGGGGGAKDFFAGRNADFRLHKDRLLREVNTIREKFDAGAMGQVGYVKVKLQSAALAKSHRPMDFIFKSNEFPLVGTGSLGELFFEVTPRSLQDASAAIGKAELEVTKRNKKNELVPSAARSEVGAIETIGLPSLSDKRRFTPSQVKAYFRRHPSARYLAVELFVDEATIGGTQRESRHAAWAALAEFRKQLKKLAAGVSVWVSGNEWVQVHLTVVRFSTELIEGIHFEAVLLKVLTFLESSSLVREISLGPVLWHSATQYGHTNLGPGKMPSPQAGVDYAVVGIVDGGVSKHKSLTPWRTGGIEYMKQSDDLRGHGTFIAGLLVNGLAFNPGQPLDSEPCKFFDFDLYSEDEDLFNANFEKGFIDMVQQLDTELADKPDEVRVVNMSLCQEQLTDPGSYSWEAALLDELADKHNVIFVLAAGNLEGELARPRWPIDPTKALNQIATYAFQGQDRVHEPGGSARNLTVGALELFDAEGLTRPARYTRRGPATSAGVKPDFAHIGGCEQSGSPLVSLGVDGTKRIASGTSFAAPMVAKTLALLDHRIQGQQPRELLLGLMYHFAKMPAFLDNENLVDIAKNFAGFGIPAVTDQMLTTDDHSITLVFADTLLPDLELSFDFSWAPALIEDGKTRGAVELTLVYSPPIDHKHKSEFARVNLDAYLRQESISKKGESVFKGKLKTEVGGQMEQSLIQHGAKWWPVKHYRKTFKRLAGTQNWRLVVDALPRAGVVYPPGGIPFAVILTISDPNKTAPVFASLRRTLLSTGTKLNDVRTAARVQLQ